MADIRNSYQHISFKHTWEIGPEIAGLLGECVGLIAALGNTPILPENRARLLEVSLVRGAQATTAIEGNTLTTQQIEELRKGVKLPPSKEYLGREVENVISALNYVLEKLVVRSDIELITPQLIRQFHEMIGRAIGEAFAARPGAFRRSNVVVGAYRPPGFEEVPALIERLCKWLSEEFRFGPDQSLPTAIVQAVVTHVYVVWIHPFADGNGRTARLLEFYLLMRAGVPNIASHILSNHYNTTRTMYYRQIELATEQGDLSNFLIYAVQGLRDGLYETLTHVQDSLLRVSWRNHIFDTFNREKGKGGKLNTASSRRRELILLWPPGETIRTNDSSTIRREIAALYHRLSAKTLLRDLHALVELKLLLETKEGFMPNLDLLRANLPLNLD
jgi:Fic family protein